MAIFSDGKWRHLKWQADLLSARTITDIEFSLPWKRRRAVGTMDGLGIVADDHPQPAWRGELFGVEVKGVNAFQYTRLVAEPYPMEYHMRQIHRYFVLSKMKLFSCIYENKSTQQFHEWVIRPVAKYMRESEEELAELNSAIEDRLLHRALAPCRHRMGKQWEGCRYAGRDGTCESAGRWPKHGRFQAR